MSLSCLFVGYSRPGFMFLQAFYLQVGYFVALKVRTDDISFSTCKYKNVKADVCPLFIPSCQCKNDIFVRAVPFRDLERHQL
jgi:hypothetical protein